MEKKLEEQKWSVYDLMVEDLRSYGYDTSAITEADMAKIADKMGNLYLNYGFVEDLHFVCELLEVPKLKEDGEDF